ncbi:uncharacterized protein LOC133525939 [Cydia pomonella]|uniref:uncharacterized protein LOC133525939 n=1 Tax=Cydia pomonella TaxID=82600 RepID=UPI002ADD4473|nr:uncharacterized protein LOC133525939 [Cydia pomonella]
MLYQHPEYQVMTKPVDDVMDVVVLHHDVGLARTRSDMRLRVGEHWLRSVPTPVASIASYDVSELKGREVDVLGFGTTDEKPIARHLHRVRLLVQDCDREGWLHCACATGAERGVCAGDSGGPVLYNGTQVHTTDLGYHELIKMANHFNKFGQ